MMDGCNHLSAKPSPQDEPLFGVVCVRETPSATTARRPSNSFHILSEIISCSPPSFVVSLVVLFHQRLLPRLSSYVLKVLFDKRIP